MKKPILKVNVRPTNYKGMLELARQVKVLMTANVGLYPTPNPTLVQLTTHITALQSAITAWGTRNNRGSHAALVALRAAVKDVQDDLTLLAAYAVNTVDNNQPQTVQLADLLDSGFAVKNVKSPQGKLKAVTGLHVFIKSTVPAGQFKLKWKKPQSVAVNSNIKSYNVYRSVTNVFAAATFLASSTKTSFIDVAPLAGNNYYFIVPVNDKGNGVPVSVWALRA